MASIVLSAVGSAAGNSIAGPTGATFGRSIGQMIGQSIGGSSTTRTHSYGARLEDLAVQTSTYGKVIPVVYGMVRLAGNVIWALPLREIATTTTTTQSGGKGGGGGARSSSSRTTYSYRATVAVAIAEGPIDTVMRIWANATLLDLSTFTWRLYQGHETQLPDALIEAYEGVGNAPAYRGMAYVVIEDFPLEDFGNRVPNFSFEVRRVLTAAEVGAASVEESITAITLIPGSGEFVYDTTVQYRQQGEYTGLQFVPRGLYDAINRHVAADKANVTVALNEMQRLLPNLQWVSVVVNWFGTSLDAGTCEVWPGVEYALGGRTMPDTWSVAGLTRGGAHLITQVDDAPIYGGTPSDASLIRLLQNLRARGLKIMLYPMMLMDVSGKPWRGHLTGSATDVASFFTKSHGYNAFINHYAPIARDYADGIIIGSEMKGLTKVMSGTPGIFPAVSALVALAASVKTTVGSLVKVTYAADWSEYHHTDSGWYQLDPLWASSSIDMVGIDAYFPLTDAPEASIAMADIQAGWTSGEGYNWYYTDVGRTAKASLSAAYAWKNLGWWWNNYHVNPNSVTTAWVPGSKKIWFTEVGFPSVDGATNQPNVFYDPDCSDGGLPHFSRGQYSPEAQRNGIQATLNQWAGSSMVERMFWWAWDARPYPTWPDRKDIWCDGDAWVLGHWLQGKLGVSPFRAMVDALLKRAGFAADDYDTSQLQGLLDGIAITQSQSVRAILEGLQNAYFFDLVESGDVLKAVRRGQPAAIEVDSDDAIALRSDSPAASETQRTQDLDLPAQIEVVALSRARLYAPAVQRAFHHRTQSQRKRTLSLPLVMSDLQAIRIAQAQLAVAWHGRNEVNLRLPMRYAHVEPADLIAYENTTWRVQDVKLLDAGQLEIRAFADDAALYSAVSGQVTSLDSLREDEQTVREFPATEALFFEMPALMSDNAQQAFLCMAVCGAQVGWQGATIYQEISGVPQALTQIDTAATFGAALELLPTASAQVWDEVHSVLVNILGTGTLSSATSAQILAGANAALLGDEIIQFRSAVLITAGQYRLSGLLRGRQGTAWAMGSHVAGERFVLLNTIARVAMPLDTIGQSMVLKAVTTGALVSSGVSQTLLFEGRGLECYAPTHLRATRASDGSMVIEWKRAARIGGAWRDYVDAPLCEEQERYDVEIMNGGTPVRQATVSAAQMNYSAADQVADFGSVQTSLNVKIYQRSAYVGRGYMAQADV